MDMSDMSLWFYFSLMTNESLSTFCVSLETLFCQEPIPASHLLFVYYMICLFLLILCSLFHSCICLTACLCLHSFSITHWLMHSCYHLHLHPLIPQTFWSTRQSQQHILFCIRYIILYMYISF